MNNDEVLVFPAGVRYGHPFSSPVDAVTWMTAAASGAYGPFLIPAWAVDVADILRPLYPSETPFPIPAAPDPRARIPVPVVGVDRASTALVTQFPPTEIALPPADGVIGPLMDVYAVTAWRTAVGAEVLVRGVFDAADKPTRSAMAKVLGAYEVLVDQSGDYLVAFLNRWITTVWTDALNGSVPVVPDPSPGIAPRSPYTTTAVGTIRLVGATL